MGMMHHPARGRGGETGPGTLLPERYVISMRLSVRDAGLLWRLAAAQAMSRGCTEDDVTETFGPMEDPSLPDCIAMLIGPSDLAGCCFEEFSIIPVNAAVGHSGRDRPAHAAQHIARYRAVSTSGTDGLRPGPARRPR